jgi:hypothetical protein
MQLNISRKTLILAGLFVVALIVVGSLLLSARAGSATASVAQPDGAGAKPTHIATEANAGDAAQAAAQFLRAFYTANYHDRTQWLAALKPLASIDGYTLLENMIAPALWPDLEKAQTVVTSDQVTVEERGLKAEGVSKLTGNTPWQIRGVSVTLAADVKWPGLTGNAHATNILLSQENGAWKFVMLLSDDQIKQFQSPTKEAK